MLLEALGYEVGMVHDGEGAVEAARAQSPDVILMDIGLPRISGYEAARRIRQDCKDKELMIIALTGWGQEDDRRRSAEAGIDHHLVKPLDLAQLKRLLAPAQAPGGV